jgi:hypothetical protein
VDCKYGININITIDDVFVVVVIIFIPQCLPQVASWVQSPVNQTGHPSFRTVCAETCGVRRLLPLLSQVPGNLAMQYWFTAPDLGALYKHLSHSHKQCPSPETTLLPLFAHFSRHCVHKRAQRELRSEAGVDKLLGHYGGGPPLLLQRLLSLSIGLSFHV